MILSSAGAGPSDFIMRPISISFISSARFSVSPLFLGYGATAPLTGGNVGSGDTLPAMPLKFYPV